MDNLNPTSPINSESDLLPDVPQIDLTGKCVANDFQVLRRLGQGGMGQVYLAEQQSLTRKVALKILRPDLAANSSALQRFQNEAKAVAKLSHANIVQVYAFGEWEGLHYVAFEYVEGKNLNQYLTKKGPPELLLALSLMRQVAAALQRAGEAGITHRDVKPENILLTRKGEVKVADFGLSLDVHQPENLTQTGVTMGTPLYMSPEQVEGNDIDPRSDIYSFGVTCYHLLSGNPPFQGSTPFEVALKHVREAPKPLETIRPDLPPELCAVVRKMMEKEPESRYQTAKEILKDLAKLRSFITGQTDYVPLIATQEKTQKVAIPSTSDSATEALPKPRRPRRPQRRMGWLIAASLLFGLAGGSAIAWSLNRNSREKGDPAPAVDRSSLQSREKKLEEEIPRYLSGTDGFKNLQAGMGLCRELAGLYLKQDKLQEAERLFLDMEQAGSNARPRPRAAESYRQFGAFGRGIVLAYRGKADESNEAFHSLFGKVKRSPITRGQIGSMLRSDVELRRHFLRALQMNRANGEEPPEGMRFLLAPRRDARPQKRPDHNK